MVSVQRGNNTLSSSSKSIEEQLQDAYLQSNQNNRSKKKKKNQDLVLIENLKKGESLNKSEVDATRLANTYDPDVDPKNTKSNRQRQRLQEISRDNPAFEDSEAEIIPMKAKPRKKQPDRDSPACVKIENEIDGVTKKKKTKKKETTEFIESDPKPARRATTQSASPPPTSPVPTDESSHVVKKKQNVKKPKAKPQQEDGGGQVTCDEAEPNKTETETSPRPKTRKKKTVKRAEPGEEYEVEAPQPSTSATATGAEAAPLSPSLAPDRDRVLQITIHRTDKLKSDFYIAHPLVRVHIVDSETGCCIKKQKRDRRVTSFFETENENVDFILPIMSLPFDFKKHQSTLPIWEESIVFNENFDYLCQKSLNVIIFFEVMDFVSMKTTNKFVDGARQDGGWHYIAWGFLKLIGGNDKPNIEKKVRLQLYQPPNRRVPAVDGQPQVFSWWKNAAQRVHYPSTLYITVKPIMGPKHVEPALRSMFAVQEERSQMEYDDLQRTADAQLLSPGRTRTAREPSMWNRLPGQSCRIPNVPMLSLNAGRKGCFVLRFSHNGRSLACGCHDKDGYPILIYEIPSGRFKGELNGHYSIIYDLCWSKSDRGLLSSSADGTARVWDAEKLTGTACKMLPHPAFVYAAKYHTHISSIVATGGFDQLVRIWSLDTPSSNGILLHELDGHLCYINALCFNDEGTVLYSGDSRGNIRIWSVNIPDEEAAATSSPKCHKVKVSLKKELAHKEIVGNAINVLQSHPSGRRLLIHTRNNMINMLDLRVDAVMCKFVGALNFREHIRSTLTPCGSFVFGGSEDGQAYVWNAESGDLVHIYSNLGFRNTVSDVSFHPFDNIVAFCSYGENNLVKVYSYDQQTAVKRELTFDVAGDLLSGRATPDISQRGLQQSSDQTMNSFGAGTTASDLSLMQSARMHRVMAKLRSVSALHSSRAEEAQAADLSNTSLMRMSGAGLAAESSLLMSLSGRQTPRLNLSRLSGRSQLTVDDSMRRKDQTAAKVIAIYNYQAQRSDELSLKRGDHVTVLFKDSDNWWMGELSDGQQGYFPANYVVNPADAKLRDSDVETDNEQHSKVHAVKTKTGELKFVSGGEESDNESLRDVKQRARKPPRKPVPRQQQENIEMKEMHRQT